MAELEDKVRDLVALWRNQTLDYPNTGEGLYAKIAVLLCADELEAVIKDEN